MAERFEIFERNVKETFDVDQILRRILDVPNNRDGIRSMEDALSIEYEDGHGESEEHFGSFEQETVPDAEKTFEGNTVDEDGHEPIEGQRGDFHFVAFEMLVDVGRFLLEEILEHVLIDLGTE